MDAMRWLTAGVCVLAILGGGALAAPPDHQAVRPAIRRGLAFLYATIKPGGDLDSRYGQQHAGGAEALALLAAIECGEHTAKPELKPFIQKTLGAEPNSVYSRAMRILAVSRLGPDAAELLQTDVDWLVRQQQPAGGWGYGPDHPTTRIRKDWSDSSNSQLALLALHEAGLAGASIPGAVWTKARSFWTRSQNADGGYGYDPPWGSALRLRGKSYGSMTAAGLATAAILASRGAAPPGDLDKLRAGALGWLEKNLAFDAMPGWSWGTAENWLLFYHWCLGRSQNALGYRTLGGRDGARESAQLVLAQQNPDGSWGDLKEESPGNRAVQTAFALLALSAADRPVLATKLALEANPASPQDLANFTQWMGVRHGRVAAWQLLTPTDKPEFLSDAPLLYITFDAQSAVPATLKPALAEYVRDGGVLVLASAGTDMLADKARALVQELLPQAREGRANEYHGVYQALVAMPAENLPPVLVFGDSLRTQAFVLPGGSAGGLQAGDPVQAPAAFTLLGNAAMCATDRDMPPTRLTIRTVPRATVTPAKWIEIARVRYRGDWNLCPQATDRLSLELTQSLSLGVRLKPAVDLSAVPQGLPLLWLTGTGYFKLTDEQKRNLKTYLEEGGTLLVDAGSGNQKMMSTVTGILEELLGPECVKPLEPESPIVRGGLAGGLGSDITHVRFTREAARRQPKNKSPNLMYAQVKGRPAVILVPYSVVAPLEGRPIYGLRGLAPDDAVRVAANVLLYALAGE